jgi:hypothetical protein
MRFFGPFCLAISGQADFAFGNQFCRARSRFLEARSVEPNVKAASLNRDSLRVFVFWRCA